MPPIDRALQRLRYWPGQTLRSRDFRDQLRLDALRRQLHNRVLHDGPGVSAGLGLTVARTAPLVLAVDCGLAYDTAGRPLLLQRRREMTASTGDSWLVLRHRPDVAGRTSCCVEIDPGCTPEDVFDLDHDVELVWHAGGMLDPRDGVVLARTIGGALDLTFRLRQARPLARPRLARGRTVRGNTPWEQWVIDASDGQGGFRKKIIGVQTFIDTAAAGFTATPCYFATLDAPDWDVATSEFAPTFFPQVADPSVDGFTFRLLMVETARRRYHAAFGTARVMQTSRGVGDRLVIEVDDVAPFRTHDVVALLRPRGDAAIFIVSESDGELRLSTPFTGVTVGETVLALGHAPRVATVTAVTPEDSAVLVSFSVSAGRTPRRNDALVRLADGAVTVVDRVVGGRLRVEEPFANWRKEDHVGFALTASAFDVRTVSVAADGARMSVVLRQADHNLTAGESVVLLAARTPLGVAEVRGVLGETIEVQPRLPAALLADLTHAALVHTTMSVQSVQLQNPGIVVEVDRPQVFREGDFVAAVDDTSDITVIQKIKGATLSLEAAIPILKSGSRLIAANWLGATSVDQLATNPPNTFTVGRASALPVPSFVVRKEGDAFSDPSNVKTASGTSVTLDAPIAGLARLDTLAIGVFPRVVTVVMQEAPDRIQVAEAGALAPGDVLLRQAAPVTAPVPLTRVGSVTGTTVQLRAPLGGLQPGERLGVVHFDDAVTLTGTTTPTTITVDRAVDAREDDFVAVLTHYADNSNAGLVEDITGQTLTLVPGVVPGDGIVPSDWIDGGLVGPAAVSVSPFQPWIRLEPSDGLRQPRPATAEGFDLESGGFRASSVYPYLVDGATGRVFVWPLEAGLPYRYRPETLSVITTFNTDFPSAFATFAQQQALAVTWIGCQEDVRRRLGCPGVLPAADPCAVPPPSSEGL